MYFIDKTNRESRAQDSRRSDYQQLQKEAKTNPDPGARHSARVGMEAIKRELRDGKKLSMRQSLIKAHRQGNTEEVKDIGDYVSKRRKYQNE